MAGNYKIKIEPILDTAKLNKQLNETKQLKLSGAGQTAGNSFASSFGRAIKERFKYSIANALIYGTQNAVKSMVNNVMELDKAQTEFRKVSDLSGASLEKFTDQAFKAGQTVAKTGTEIVQAATEFRKSGFGDQDSLQLAKVASMYQNVADAEITAGEAANFIVSQMKAYNMTAGEAEHIIDAVNEVSNKFAVSSADIATNIGKASAAMATGNVTYEQSIGLMTGMVEITRSGTKAARGLVTIQSRFNQIVDDSSSTGKKLLAFYTEHGIKVKDNEGQLRSFYDVASDLSNIWDTLSENEQRYYLNTQAGANQSQNLAALMRNFNTVIEATATAENAAGSAARENAKYLDSIQGHLSTLRSTWIDLSRQLLDSSTIKGVIDLGTDALKVVSQIVGVLDKLPGKMGAIVGIAGILGGILGAKKLWAVAEGFIGIGKGVEAVSAATKGATSFTSLFAKDLTSWVAGGTSVIGVLSTLIPVLIAVGGAFAIANAEYKNSFKGKLDEYKKIGDEILDLETQIDSLESKEGELTSQEETRLSILKMQLEVLKQQEAQKAKQTTHAFDKYAKEKMHGKEHKEQGETVVERDATIDEQYNKALEKRYDLQKKIKHLEEESRKHPLTEEQTKQLEKYNNQLDKVWKTEDAWVDKLIEEHDALSNINYEELGDEGKAYYDKIHSAYVGLATDTASVKEAIAQTISTFGSAQFDAWNIDVSSLKNVDDLVTQISEKISTMGDEEEITLYARDEAGNIIDEITRKKGELTDEEWELVVNATTTGDYDKLQEYINGDPEHKEVLMDFVEHGIGQINAEADDAAKTRTADVNVTDNGTAGQTKGQIDAIQGHNVNIPVNQSGEKTSGIQSSINSVQGKNVHINIFKTIWESIKKKAKGKRKGEEGGMAWLGDEGSRSNPKPELVVGEDGAYLAGTQGWELRNLKSSDTVYTAAQTKKLLSGSQTFEGSVGELPRYKKGKKAKVKTKQQIRKETQKKASQKTKEKWQKQFEAELKNLKHKAKVNHWSDAKYQSEYQKLYNKWYAKATSDQLNDYAEAAAEYDNSLDKAEAERLAGLVGVGGLTAASAVASINAQSGLSATEKQDYRAKAYQESVEYNLKEYKNGKATRAQIVKDIQNYYNTRGKYDEEYYKMLNELREADKEKEIDRLKELQKAQENRLSLAEKYIKKELDSVKKQIEADKEENEQLEKMAELEKDLAQAKNKKIRIYREGVGFVYEEDVEAVQEAEKALSDYKSTLEKTPLEQRAEELQAILDLFDEMADNSAIRELEVLLGVSGVSGVTGGLTSESNLDAWASWIKKAYASSTGYADLIAKLEKIGTSDINSWLTANGGLNVSDSVIAQYINNHSFASGTLSAPGGLSRVAERLGGELVWLGKGDSVYSNAVSRNLMEWGRYTPAQVMNSNSSAQSQVFNFDKIVLPNVHNAEEFYRELQNLPNKALQQSTRRV